MLSQGNSKRTIISNMAEHLLVPHLPQGDLTPIAMSQEIFHGVQTRA
jgi:hypothetical protein